MRRALTPVGGGLVCGAVWFAAAIATAQPHADSTALEAGIDRGIAFLLQAQNPDGSWGSARRTKELNIYAPVPGGHHAFRAAVTSLCVSALIESEDRRKPVIRAIEHGEAWLLKNLSALRRADGIALYNVWGHSYAIQALVRLTQYHHDNAARSAVLRSAIDHQIDMLRRYAVVDGGWGYYDFGAKTRVPSGSSISFTTATALVALDEARDIDCKIPQPTVDKAIAAIKRQQKPDFSYVYGEYLKWQPMAPINRPGGSLGRSQACNIALRRWGDTRITDQVLIEWLDRLFARNGWLSMARKRPIPHESHFAVAGYFYYYGHFYAGYCIDALPAAERARFRRAMADVLLPLQEKDGSWWDYPLYDYHQPYGTSMAVMTLVRCREPHGEEAR